MKTKIVFLLLLATCFAKQLRFLEEVNNGRVLRTAAEIASDAKKVYDTVKNLGSGGMKFMGHVGMIIDAAATIVETFGSSKSTVLHSLRKGEGFEKFEASMEFDFTLGYRNKGFDFFMQDMFEHANIPENYRGSFNHSLDVAKLARTERFCDYNFAFNKDENKKDPKKKDYMSYLNVLIYKFYDQPTRKKKFNAIIISAEARLKLFPDELIYQTTERAVGGISESTTLHSEFQDRDLTPEVVQGVMAYFELSSLRELCKLAGIKISDIVPK